MGKKKGESPIMAGFNFKEEAFANTNVRVIT